MRTCTLCPTQLPHRNHSSLAVPDFVMPICWQDVDPNTPKGAPVVGSCGYGELVSSPCRPEILSYPDDADVDTTGALHTQARGR